MIVLADVQNFGRVSCFPIFNFAQRLSLSLFERHLLENISNVDRLDHICARLLWGALFHNANAPECKKCPFNEPCGVEALDRLGRNSGLSY